MKITYDPTVDALYIKFISGHHELRTRQIDDDINIDFNDQNQMVGIEVLGASRRLRLSEFGQKLENLDTGWTALTEVLKSNKKREAPIAPSLNSEEVWVKDLSHTHIVFKSESGELREVTASQLRYSQSEDALLEALRKIGNYADTVKVK